RPHARARQRAARPRRRAWRSARPRGRTAPSADWNGGSRDRWSSSRILLVVFRRSAERPDARLAQEDGLAGPVAQPAPGLTATRERRLASRARGGTVQDQLLPAVHVVEPGGTRRAAAVAAGGLADREARLD